MSTTSSAWSRWLHTTLGLVAALLLLAMMALTSVDVIGRYLFNRPLYGAFELTELMLAALIFLGLPLVTERGEHVTVDITDTLLPHGIIRFKVMLMNWLSALVLAVLAWQLWDRALSLAADGNVTNTLAIPLSPFGYLMAVSCALTALILLVQGVQVARELFASPDHRNV